MSGGKSSSSTAQTTSTQQLDKRIGATDNAVVLTAEGASHITYNELDGGAFEAAKEIALEALKGVLGGAGDAISAVNTANEKAYAFADAARVQENEKNYKSTIQWVAIVLVVGIAVWGYVNAKR